MDSVIAAYRTEQVKIKSSRRNGGEAFVSKPSSENFDIYGGILHPRPPSRSLSAFNNHFYRQNPQPPLLPLPISAVQQPLLSRSLSHHGLSCPPQSSRRNRIRDTSLTPKKSKQPKREEVKRGLKSASRSISELVVHSDDRLGPDPNELPKQIPIVLTTTSGNIETFPDSVFNLSPPPSSLPLPKFSLRPKLGCKAEAAGVDTGATDNLRRLLRLR